jgi:electron transport complex protein RnfD
MGQPLESLWPLFVGNVNGSLGETSALACLLGGIYLSWRRTATWEVPVLVIAGTALFGGLAQLAGVTPEITVLEHLLRRIAVLRRVLHRDGSGEQPDHVQGQA